MMRLNPVLENEMKRNMRSMKGSWIIFGTNFVLTMVAVITYFGTGGFKTYLTAGQYCFPIRCYMMMAYAMFGMVCLLVPGIAGGSIAVERERKTLDILLTTHLSPWRIVIGKLESSLSVIFLIAFSSIPVVSLILVFGGVSLIDLLMLVVMLVVSGVFIGSIGIFCSSVMRKMTTATIMSYVLTILLTFGTVLFIWVVSYILGVHNQEMSAPVDVGPWIYLFLLNPLVIYFGLLSGQVGSGSELMMLCNHFGSYSDSFGVSHMLILAVLLQILISVVLLFTAGKWINPLKKDG